MKKYRLMLLLSIGLTACSSPSPRQVAKETAPAAASTDIECHAEKATGSNIPTRVCTTAEQRAALEQQMQTTRRSMNGATGGACQSGGVRC
jgi:hypothetical protein